jgi:hypothetical protein
MEGAMKKTDRKDRTTEEQHGEISFKSVEEATGYIFRNGKSNAIFVSGRERGTKAAETAFKEISNIFEK